MSDEQQPLIGVSSKKLAYSSGEAISSAQPRQQTSTSTVIPEVRVVNSMTRPGRSASEPSYQSFEADANGSDTSHCHDGQTEESDEIRKGNMQARRKLIIASIFCLVFMIAETIGGAIANSLAIMTDAAHLLTDFASFMISLLALYIASRPATKRMSYGWHRAEVVGAIVSVLLIWVVTGILVYLAVVRIVNNQYEINGLAMLITSAFGIGVNIIMGLTLHQHSHGHGHDHDHDHDHGHSHSHGQKKDSEARTPTAGGSQQQTPRPHDHDHGHSHDHGHNHSHDHDHGHNHAHKHEHGPDGHHNHEHSHEGNNQDVERGLTSSHTASAEQLNNTSGGKKKSGREDVNINVRAAFIHVLGDLLQSVGVFIAALIIYFKPEYKIADPICTFIFSILVLITTINILRDALNVIMEATPHGLDFNDVRDTLLAVPGVRAVHNLRLWSLTMNKTAMSAHLAIAKKYDQQAVLKRAMNDVKEKFGIVEVTIQIEEHSVVMDRCAHCTPPAH